MEAGLAEVSPGFGVHAVTFESSEDDGLELHIRLFASRVGRNEIPARSLP